MLSTSNSLLTDYTLGLYLILNTPLHQPIFSGKPILNHQPTNNRVSKNCFEKPKHPPLFHLRWLDLIQCICTSLHTRFCREPDWLILILQFNKSDTVYFEW